MEFDLNQCRKQLNSSDRDAAIALRTAVDAIPHSLPLLPSLYSKYRSTSNPALHSWTFSSIGRFKELAIPFILTLLASDDPRARCDAIDLLIHNYRPSVQIAYPSLPDRPTNKPLWGEHYLTVVGMLTAALFDPVRDVRVRATTALDDIGDAPMDIVEILADGLNSDDAITCYNAACSLGRLQANAATALPALREMIERRRGTDGMVIRPVHAAQIAILRIEGTEQRREPKPST
jgi:HEAT repeat protein